MGYPLYQGPSRRWLVVTRNLGIKYLWIDELCIAPQDTKDWARDSANVGAAFTNAYLTLAATGAKDMSEGLFLQRKPREYIHVDYTTAGNVEGQIMACALPLDKEAIDEHYLDMKSEPLSQDILGIPRPPSPPYTALCQRPGLPGVSKRASSRRTV